MSTNSKDKELEELEIKASKKSVEEKKEPVKPVEEVAPAEAAVTEREPKVKEKKAIKHGVTVTALNVRVAPGLNSDIAGVAFRGEKLEITESDDPEWVKVSNGKGLIGYCVKDYISIV